MIDVVDENDAIVGSAQLRACLEQGLLHRAVAVLILRGGGKVLLQQRSKRDPWHPGLWTVSCTGHVRKGESYGHAARRELREELGLRSPLSEHTKIRIPTLRCRGLIESEWVTFFVSVSRAHVAIDHLELEGTEEVTLPHLRQMLDGRKLTPDAKIILRNYLRGVL